MIYLTVCDDDLTDLLRTGNLLSETSRMLGLDTLIQSFSALDHLLHAIREDHLRTDMLFLDIEFGEENSLMAAKEIAELLPNCQIVFLTNYMSYALDVYEVPHLYFAVKEEFPQRVASIFRMFFSSEERIALTMGGTTDILSLREIYCVERIRRSSLIMTASGVQRTTIVFEELADRVRAPYMVRCHNSYLVNLQHVVRYRADAFVLTNGTSVPISRTYQKRVREQFRQWQEVWV